MLVKWILNVPRDFNDLTLSPVYNSNKKFSNYDLNGIISRGQICLFLDDNER